MNDDGPKEPQDDAQRIFALGDRLRTWGKWGDEDEKGALNYITAEHRVRAAGLVRRGAVISLALPIRSGKGPMITGISGRFNPLHHMTATGLTPGPVEMGATADITDDLLIMGCQSSTQWDALCHVYYGERMYNGFPAESVTTEGAAHDHIEKVHKEFVGRGVLLDIARFQNVEALEPSYEILGEELSACAVQQEVEIRDGDMVLVRTGAMTCVSDDDWTKFHSQPRPGLHYTVAEWLAARKVAAVAADTNAVEAPSRLEGVRNPFHMLALRDMGVHLGEYWYLETLAEDCAKDGVYEFMLVAQALRIDGGAGSPLNPLAIK